MSDLSRSGLFSLPGEPAVLVVPTDAAEAAEAAEAAVKEKSCRWDAAMRALWVELL